jgi:outer membrane protein OmpA-like peptidoglycan-associated protein
MKTGYIFDMRLCRRLLPQVLCALVLASAPLAADPNDVESSRDYPAFPRPPGYVISDYDEDNPAQFDFPVAQPLAIDADNIEKVHVTGHRYVIRYELNAGARALTVFQTQQYYEKIADDAGFRVEKSGAVGDVTETFHRISGGHETWAFLEPAVMANVLTVVESGTSAPPTPPPPPRLAVTTKAPTAVIPIIRKAPATSVPPPAPPPIPAPVPNPVPIPAPTRVTVPAPATLPPPPPPAPSFNPNDDSLYTALSKDGRVIVPFTFQPGKNGLDASSQPQVDRVVAMMKRHPDLFLRIEGHTDNSGDPDDNLRLSAERAFAVQAILLAAHIDQKRLDAVGVGGLQPLASNSTAEGREKNRRIELVMWKKYPALHAPPPPPSLPSRTGL